MSGIFPLRGTVDLDEDRGPRLVDLDDDVADEVFDALSSRTTRTIFAELHTSPQTASDLAEVTDTSVQNAQYHLEKLVAADLVEVVDTWYSERGTEMKVYGPTDESLVLFAGRDKEQSLRALVKRLVSGLAVLVPGSVVAAWLADRFTGRGTESVRFAGGEPSSDTGTSAGQPRSAAESTEATGADSGGDSAGRETGTGGDSGDGGGDGGGAVGDADTPMDTPAQESEYSLNSNVSDGEQVDVTLTERPEPVDVSREATPNPAEETLDVAYNLTGVPDPGVEPTDAVVQTAAGTDPALLAGLSFFLGGLFVLTLATAAWYWRS